MNSSNRPFSDPNSFLAWEAFCRDSIDVKRAYIDAAGDLVAGILLSQIIYWHLPNKDTGAPKLRVYHNGHLWLAKGRDDWWEEIRITPRQFDRASQILVDRGIIKKQIFKFNGSPTVHIRLCWPRFLEIMSTLVQPASLEPENPDSTGFLTKSENPFNTSVKSISTKGESSFSPNVDIDFTQTGKSLTKNTTENTTETFSPSIYPSKRTHKEEPKRQIERQADIQAFLELLNQANLAELGPVGEELFKPVLEYMYFHPSFTKATGMPLPLIRKRLHDYVNLDLIRRTYARVTDYIAETGTEITNKTAYLATALFHEAGKQHADLLLDPEFQTSLQSL